MAALIRQTPKDIFFYYENEFHCETFFLKFLFFQQLHIFRGCNRKSKIFEIADIDNHPGPELADIDNHPGPELADIDSHPGQSQQ